MNVLRSRVMCVAFACLTCQLAANGWAQTRSTGPGQVYPAKVVRYLVPFSAGSGSDTIGRIIAGGLTQVFGQQVIVDNRAGAAGNIGAELAAKAPADGYAIFQVNMGHAANVTLYSRLRALAVTTARRLPLLPEYPTVIESGFPGYEAGNWYGLLVPAKTPKETIATIRSAALSALNRPEVGKRLSDLGYVTVGDQPEEFAAHIRSEIAKLAKILRGLRVTAS